MDTVFILLLAIAIFAIPAWLPVLTKREMSPRFKLALWVTAAGELTQAAFVTLVGAHVLPLSDSLRAAAIGIPLCIAGLVLGIISRLDSGQGTGCALSSAFGLLCWAFLVTLH